MNVKTNISAPGSAQLPSFSTKNESVPKEVVSLGKEVSVSFGRETSAADGREKRGEASTKEMAEMQDFLRKALDVDPIAQRKLQLSIEKELDIVVVKVLDKESGDLVRQIPMPTQISVSKDLQVFMDRLANSESGIAVNQEV